jgi:hypothetical protein
MNDRPRFLRSNEAVLLVLSTHFRGQPSGRFGQRTVALYYVTLDEAVTLSLERQAETLQLLVYICIFRLECALQNKTVF